VTWDAPRAVTAEEWSRLREAANRVFRPEGARDLTTDSPLLFDPENRQQLRVITAAGGDGAIAAHAGFVVRDAYVYRRRIRVACVGAVFTTAQHRRQGLATAVLADALRLARRKTDLVLASGDRDLYRRQNLEPIPPLARFRIGGGSGPVRAAPADLAVRALRPESADDVQAAAALYEAEPVHFARSPADWQRLLGAGLLADVPATVSLVLRGSRPVAYLAVQQAGKRPDGSTRPRRALEVAGDRAALVAAAAGLADELLVPVYDEATIAAAEGRRWPRTTRQFLVTAEALTADVLAIPWYGLNYL
jgi:GNAT superfamily N-acetyltransferase